MKFSHTSVAVYVKLKQPDTEKVVLFLKNHFFRPPLCTKSDQANFAARRCVAIARSPSLLSRAGSLLFLVLLLVLRHIFNDVEC